MEIQDTILLDIVNDVNRRGVKETSHKYECKIEANKIPVAVLYVGEHELIRNYFENYTDIRRISVMIPEGHYNKFLVPNRENIKVTLRKIRIGGDKSIGEKKTAPIIERHFIGTLYDRDATGVEGNFVHQSNPNEVTNSVSIKQANLLLVTTTVDNVRKKTVGGIFRDTSGANLIRTILTNESKVKFTDPIEEFKGVDLSPGYSEDKRKQIIVPHMTKLSDFPKVVNSDSGGVYDTGFRCYLQNNHWYVFPPFDVKKFWKGYKTLTVANMPSSRLVEPEVSYIDEPGKLTILTSGETKYTNLSEDAVLNSGSAIRFVDASKVMNDYITVEDNKATVTKNSNITEAVQSNLNIKDNNLVSQQSVKITSQHRLQYSELAARSGAILQVTWTSSDVELVYPGMGVKYMYLSGDIPQTMYGVLISAQSVSAAVNTNVHEPRFREKTVLTIFVDRKVQSPED